MRIVDGGNNKLSSLEERFRAFLNQLDDAENIDNAISEAELRGGQRADFLLARRRIILELKTIETDPEYKIEERLAPHRERPEFPLFYWQADLDEVLSYLPDREEIQRKITHAVTRSVQGALEKADDQIEATKRALNIPQACGVVVILNEKVAILSPTSVTSTAEKILLKRWGNSFRYKNISYVWVISESHRLAASGSREYLPLILLEGPSAKFHADAEDYLDGLQSKWAEYEGVPLVSLGSRQDLDSLRFEERKGKQANKGSLARHEVWRHTYRQHPYLRELAEEQFLDYAAQVISAMISHFLVGGKKLPPNVMAELMERWTHVLEEAEFRRLDMKKLQARLPGIDSLPVTCT